jgi:hypothetical protein
LQRPLAVSGRRLAQPHGNQFRLPIAIEFGRRGWILAFLTLQCQLEAFRHQTFADILDGLYTAIERLGNPLVGPSRPIRIRFEQNLRTPRFLRRSLKIFDHLLAGSTLFVR